MPGTTSPFRWEIGLALIVVGEAVRLAGVAAWRLGFEDPEFWSLFG